MRASESLLIVTAGSHAVLELCRVAVSAYGSPLWALHAMGDTDAGEGYYCGVSERANACVFPGLRCCLMRESRYAAGGTCAALRCCWGVIERALACVWGLRRVFTSAAVPFGM